jgi:serine/threonine-protein kinase HipA
MARHKTHTPLLVYQNNRLVGRLLKESSGAISFTYHESWLAWPTAWPISLSMPMRPTPYKGEAVIAVFDNLLPDSDVIRRRVAEKMGAAGTDAYSLLSVIGRDCVGAMQFLPEDEPSPEAVGITGEPVNDDEIERILKGLARAPLGLDKDDDFRISVAGAQEKTALLWHEGQWLRPTGTTPTTHIFKTQLGHLPSGVDLTNSVENEFFCLRLLQHFGLSVCNAEMRVFGATKALVIERFDRKWLPDGRLIRLPQEDMCQALGVPSTRKYENEGGPGMVDILRVLAGSNSPKSGQTHFFMAQILFWLMGATDGHAKNFSISLFPGGGYELTPFYDVLTVQPAIETGQLQPKQARLAMAVGDNRHYRLDEISFRHFLQTARKAGLPAELVKLIIFQIAERAEAALLMAQAATAKEFDASAKSIGEAFLERLKWLEKSELV